MNNFWVEISFLNTPSQTLKVESNDNVTAFNMALNRLNSTEQSNVIGVKFTYISEHSDYEAKE